MLDTETGESQERRLKHRQEAEQFYRALAIGVAEVRVGMEASGHAAWFERLLAELKVELWVGDAAVIRAKRVRKEKTDRQDAQHILKLMLKDDFPTIWVPSWENRDLRQLLWHRHRMVQMRTRIMNQLQATALNEGSRYKKKLWREAGRKQLESLSLAPWASRRREDLLEVLDRINPTIAELTQAIEEEAEKCPQAGRLMTHPGVGALTAVAFVLIIGQANRFTAANRSRPMWVWFQKKIPAESDDGWATSVNRATPCYVFCWWKRRRSRYARMRAGATSFSTWGSDAAERSPKSPWLEGWRFGCTGCGAENGITSNWKGSVRTRDSPEIAMVCSKSPT
jgi:transposase